MTRTVATLLLALAVGALPGCSLFSSGSVERAANAASSAHSRLREAHLTLVGGSRLNVGGNGTPRPVLACVYVVRVANWAPMGTTANSSCIDAKDDSMVAVSSRHVIAPNQLLQFSMDVPATGDLWLVVDADFAPRPARYAPLRLRIGAAGVMHFAAWLDRNGIHNALLPGPVPVGSESFAAPAARTADPRRARQ